MALNVPIDKQGVDNIPDESNYCFKCGGELEIVEDIDFDETGCVNTSWLRCIECGQRNNWYEKEQWLKKQRKN